MNDKIYTHAEVLKICKKVVNDCIEYAEYCNQYAAYEYPMQYNYGYCVGKAESVRDVMQMFVTKMLETLGSIETPKIVTCETMKDIAREIDSICFDYMHTYEIEADIADSEYNRGYYVGKIAGIRYGLVEICYEVNL